MACNLNGKVRCQPPNQPPILKGSKLRGKNDCSFAGCPSNDHLLPSPFLQMELEHPRGEDLESPLRPVPHGDAPSSTQCLPISLLCTELSHSDYVPRAASPLYYCWRKFYRFVPNLPISPSHFCPILTSFCLNPESHFLISGCSVHALQPMP